jgi:hypothetical protein
MSSSAGKRPLCVFCQKPLRKYTYGWWPTSGPGPLPEVGHKAEFGHVVEIIRTEQLPDGYAAPRVHVTYWCGEWGYCGNGSFCSLRCGYMWALNDIRLRTPKCG